MSHSNGIISSPVYVLEDVAYILGENFGSLGALCQSSRINKWARYKPFSYPAMFKVISGNSTPALRQPSREAPLISKNCGLCMRSYGSSDLAWSAGIALEDGGTNWVHAAPSGTIATSPFRNEDFDGYNLAAEAPFQFAPVPNPAYKTSSISVDDSAGAGTAEIAQSDLAGDGTMIDSNYGYYNIASYNIYCMMGKRNGSTPASSPSLIFAQSSQIPQNLLSEGTWDCVIVFTNKTFTDGTYVADNGNFILAPIGRRSFVYHATLGVNYNDTYIESLRVFLRLRLSSYPASISYYKLVVVTKDAGGTLIGETDVDGGSSGTLYSSSVSSFSVRVNLQSYPNAQFYLRFWVNSSQYYEERFYPAESTQ